MTEEPQDQVPNSTSATRGGGLMPIMRIILYVAAIAVGSLFAGILAFVVWSLAGISLGHGRIASVSSPLAMTVYYVPMSIASVLITLAFVRLVDHRPVETLGYVRRGPWIGEILLGLGLGVGLPCLMFLISYLFGWTAVTGTLFRSSAGRIAATTLQTVILMTAVAVNEETIVRGYILQTLKTGYGAVAALIASSTLFGLGHLGNEGAGFPAFLGTLAAGIVLGYAYLVTKRLWVSVALHFAWNFTLGPVLGFPVSGVDLTGWVVQRFSGPPLWTGGRFGPEAGLMGLIVWIIGVPAIWYFAKRTSSRTAVSQSPVGGESNTPSDTAL